MASAAIKRARKRKRMDTDGDPEFQVAPMVDVLLVLMLFFMAITSTEVLRKTNVELPDAEHGKTPGKKRTNEILVNVGWNKDKREASFDLDGKGFPSVDEMRDALAAQHAKNPQAYVLIRADKDAEYSNVAAVMSICADAGIGTVTFSVLTGGNKAPAGAAH